ncbi:MAG: hypothetical protein KIT31_25785 [Deltaproteobacteria bacterium]|nr:hypothetical protein [Deltaproteobacteria bacterium]
MSKTNAAIRDGHEGANDAAKADPNAERLALLKQNVVGPWSTLLAQIPAASDPKKVTHVRNTAYELLFERKPGYDAFAAYLSADPALAPYLKAAQEADAAVNPDRAQLAHIIDAVVQLGANAAAKDDGLLQRAHGQCLAAYVKMSGPGRQYVRKQAFVQSIASPEVKSLLLGESKLAPLEIAPKQAGADAAGDDKALQPQVDGLRDQILAIDVADRSEVGRKARRELSQQLGKVDARVLDKLRGNLKVTAKLAEISAADRADVGHPADYMDVAWSADSVMQLWWGIRQLDKGKQFEQVKAYLAARPGPANLALRSRVMQNEFIARAVGDFSAEQQQVITRLVARGTAEKSAIDTLHDAGAGKASAADAVRAAIEMARDPSFDGLRGDQLFRHAIESGNNRVQVVVEGIHTSAYDFVLRSWGVIPNAPSKDPESALPQDAVNPTGEKAPDEKEMAKLHAVFPPTVQKLGAEFASWFYVKDKTIIDALLEFENTCAAPDMRDLFRRAKMHPGVELQARANADSRIGNIRDKLHRGLSDDTRQVAERVLGIRVDAAAVGRIDGQVTLADDAHGQRAGGVVPLMQALREVKSKGGPTVTQVARSTAEKIADKLNAWHVWGGCAKVDVTTPFQAFRAMFDQAAEVKEGQPAKTVMQTLEEETGMKGRLHPIELLVNVFHEVPGGGDLAGRIQERVEDSEKAATLKELGLDAAAVAVRNKVPEPPPQSDLEKEADGLYQKIVAAQSMLDSHHVDVRACEEVAKAWARARSHDQPQQQQGAAQPAAGGAQTFSAAYRGKYGIDPHRHIVDVARALAARFDDKSDKQAADNNLTSLAQTLGITKDEIRAEVKAPAKIDVATEQPLPSGYTPQKAKAAADKIWQGLKDGDVVVVRRELDGRRPDEQELIKRFFKELSGDVELEFYVRQALEGAQRGGMFAAAGGEGVHGQSDPGRQLANTSDARSWTETLDIAQKGSVGILTRVKVALDNSDKNEIFGIIDDATPEQRRQIMGDEPTMGLLRDKLGKGVDFDRVYAVLTGTADMATRLYSRSEGNVDSSFWRHFSDTDTEGMKRDIKDYAARRKEFHTRALEDAGQNPERNPNFEDAVAARVKDDLLKVYDNPDARKVIENEFPAWFTSGPNKVTGTGRSIEGQLLNSGTDANTSAITSDGFEWSSDILAQVRALAPEQRKRYRNDAEFLQKTYERTTSIINRKLILLALQSDEPVGEDHITKLVELKSGLTSGGEARDNIARLSKREIDRLRAEPELVTDICAFLDKAEQARFRKLLGFDTAAAVADIGAKKVEPPADASAAQPQGATEPAPAQYQLAEGSKGTIDEAEVQRLGYLKEQAMQRLHLGAKSSWFRLLGEAVEVYKADFKPKFAPLPASTEPPQPGAAATADAQHKADQAKLDEEAKAKERELRLAVWNDVSADVFEAADRNHGNDKNDNTIYRAVMKLTDPSDERLKSSFSSVATMFNDDADIEKTIKEASEDQILNNWSSIVVKRFAGAGGESFAEVYEDYRTAKAAAAVQDGQPPPSPEVMKKKQQTGANFARYVVEPSLQFENLVLPNAGSFLKDKDPTTRPDQQLDRKNPQFAKYRGALNERIRGLDAEKVSAKLGITTGSEDAQMVASRLRGALTNFHIAQEDYAKQRGDGQSFFGQDEGRRLDRAFGDYRKELGDAEDKARDEGGGDISARDRRKLDKLDEDIHSRATDYAAAKEAAAQLAATVVGTIVGVVVTALTAGAATPLAMMMYGALTAAAAATGEVVTKQVVLGGRNYDAGNEGAKQIASAALTGFVTGGAQYYAGQLTNSLVKTTTAAGQGKALGEIAVKAPSTWARVLQGGGRTLAQGTLTGFADAAGSALDPSVWVHGWDEGWYRALDAGMTTLRSQPATVLRSTITSMLGDAVAGSSYTISEQARPGERIGMERVLAQAGKDLPVNLATAVFDTGVGVASGEIKDVRGGVTSVATQTAKGVEQVGQGLHDGSVQRGRAERHAQAELAKHPELFKSETERRLFVQAVESAMLHGDPPSAVEFASARNAVAHSLATKNPHFATLPADQQAQFLAWVREAPTSEEMAIRSGRNPQEVISAAATAKPAETTPALATSRRHVADAEAAVARIGELQEQSHAAERPATAEEAQAALDRAIAAKKEATDLVKTAADSEAAIRKRIAELPATSPEVPELARQAELAASAKRRGETLLSLLDQSRLAMTAFAQASGLLPRALPGPTAEAPAKPTAHDFSKVKPGEIPPGLNPEQQARFEEAKRLFEQLKTDKYQGEDIAKLRWQTYLGEHGIEVARPKVDEAHTAKNENPGEIRENKKQEQQPAHADAHVAADTTIGQRMTNTGKVSEVLVRRALDEIAKRPLGFTLSREHAAGSDSIWVELPNGKEHQIKIIDAAPTNGELAGLKRGAHDNETIVFVSDTITDDHVPRALGAIIHEAIARAGKSPNENASSFGQLDAMFAHLRTVSEQAPPPPAAGNDSESVTLAAQEAGKRESPARISAEIDLLLHKLGLSQPGETRDALLKKMPPDLAERVRLHLASHEAVGFKPEAAITDPSKVARPQPTEATTLAGSKVLPDAPAETRPYSEVDKPKVLELRVHLETIKEIDARLGQRDQRNASGAEIAKGETLRRREHVDRVKQLLAELQLGGTDKAYYEARLKELAAVFPGIENDIVPAVKQRVESRLRAEQSHKEAEAFRVAQQEAQKALEEQFKSTEPFITDRVVVGTGMTALADVASLGVSEQGKQIDPKQLLMVGGPDLIARLDPTGNWGQRAEVFDPEGGKTAHPMFQDADGGGNGTLRNTVEDAGEFIHVGELNDAMDLARKKLGVVSMPGKVEGVEIFTEGKVYDPPWHEKAQGTKVRVAIRGSDGVLRYAYTHNTDITTGLGATAMPNEGLLTERDRKAMIESGTVFGGEQLLQGTKVAGKRVLVVAFGPTGAWAAVEAVKQGALRVDWAGGSGAAPGEKGDNASSLKGVQGLDRTQDAFKAGSNIHTTTDRIVSIEGGEGGAGAVVTFAYGTGEEMRTYQVKYDAVAMTAGFDTSGTRPSASGPEATPGTILGKGKDGIEMQAQKGTKAPVIESKDGSVRVLGPAAWDGVNTSPEEKVELEKRKKLLELTADSPDARTMEAGGQIAEEANKHVKKKKPEPIEGTEKTPTEDEDGDKTKPTG